MASSGAHETQTLRSDASYGGLAQLGERLHGMQEVTGSIPVFSTIGSNKSYKHRWFQIEVNGVFVFVSKQVHRYSPNTVQDQS